MSLCEWQVSIHAPLARSNYRCKVRKGRKVRGFNTCSSCEEQRRRDGMSYLYIIFNTCSSCEEQLQVLGDGAAQGEFQYMLLLRGATQPENMFVTSRVFQYMLLLRGATGLTLKRFAWRRSFNTCSSCEEQLNPLYNSSKDSGFQYMLLLRGAT